jgi:hypothetical protein
MRCLRWTTTVGATVGLSSVLVGAGAAGVLAGGALEVLEGVVAAGAVEVVVVAGWLLLGWLEPVCGALGCGVVSVTGGGGVSVVPVVAVVVSAPRAVALPRPAAVSPLPARIEIMARRAQRRGALIGNLGGQGSGTCGGVGGRMSALVSSANVRAGSDR